MRSGHFARLLSTRLLSRSAMFSASNSLRSARAERRVAGCSLARAVGFLHRRLFGGVSLLVGLHVLCVVLQTRHLREYQHSDTATTTTVFRFTRAYVQQASGDSGVHVCFFARNQRTIHAVFVLALALRPECGNLRDQLYMST